MLCVSSRVFRNFLQRLFRNHAGALEFYRRLGAVAAETRIMGVAGESLRALAAAAP